MVALDGRVIGREQVILLPITPTTFNLARGERLHSGSDAVVVSGLYDIFNLLEHESGFFLDHGDDDDIIDDEVTIFIGPLWQEVVQASASVSIAGILSLDTDVVDHSRWLIRECRVDTVDRTGGKRIRLQIKIQTQGDGNGWQTLACQVIATGSLARPLDRTELSVFSTGVPFP